MTTLTNTIEQNTSVQGFDKGYKWGLKRRFNYLQIQRVRVGRIVVLYLNPRCVCKETAQSGGYDVADVRNSFRQVKLKLNDEDTFAHYTVDVKKRRSQFKNLSVTDRTIVRYQWDFGDGRTSTEASPFHEYIASGDYVATLEVEDNLGVKDSFTRLLAVDDQYCSPDSTLSESRLFTSVNVAGESVAFVAEEFDYTNQIVEVVAGEPITLNIEGTILDDDDSSLWYVWVDLNDDAKYGNVDQFDDDNSEQRLREEQLGGVFGLDKSFTIPTKYVGQTLYMRISADHSFPCSARKGSTFDIRLKVNAP